MKRQKETNFGSQLVKTIYSDDEVEDFSDDSNDECEFQPSKQKKRRTDFDKDFKFVDSVEEYNKNTWDDIKKYVKRKATTKTDDKIKKVRSEHQTNDEALEEHYSSDCSLSSEELQHDHIKIKEKKKKNKNNRKKEEVVEETEEDVYSYDESMNFHQMNLSRPLLKAITQMEFTHPTPIQAATVPVALLGKDIYGCAATGTGKTAAYMLPTVERLLFRPNNGMAVTRVLVLVPTRELGVQVYQVTNQLCQFTDIQVGLSVGGLDVKVQENVLRKNPDIVIATPGRLIDHLHGTPTFGLDSIEILILDEADRMLDEYFAEQMKEIIKQCSRTRQTMLFSATMNDEVNELVAISLKSPVRIFVNSNKGVAFNLRQEFIRIRSNNDIEREAVLAALVCRTFRDRCIIFVSTKKQAHRLHILLGLLGVKIAELHGNLTQPQRLDTLERFKTEQVDIVVATDVAARGLDIVGIKTVINFTMPRTLEHYIHRVGRTARAGRAGVSISLAGEQERKVVKDIIKNAKKPVKSRIVPTEIIDKYRRKLEDLESKIEEILKEELEERLMSKMEKQLNRTENLLKGDSEPKRPWFQTKQERKDEKEKLESKAQGLKKKIKETLKINPKDRIAKQKGKQKKIRTCKEPITSGSTSKPKKKSNFVDLCDTRQENAKKLRHISKFNQGGSNKKGNKNGNKNKGKAFGQPKNKGKAFGPPKSKGKVFGKPKNKK